MWGKEKSTSPRWLDWLALSLSVREFWWVSRAPCPVPTTSIYLSTSHYTPRSPISIWTCPFCGIKNWYSSWCRLICRELPLFFVSTPPHPLMMLLLHCNGSLKTCPNIHCRRVSTSNGRRRRGEEGAIRRWWNRQKGGAQTTLKHWTTDSIKDMSACTAARWQQYVTINLIGIDEKFTWSTACPVLYVLMGRSLKVAQIARYPRCWLSPDELSSTDKLNTFHGHSTCFLNFPPTGHLIHRWPLKRPKETHTV